MIQFNGKILLRKCLTTVEGFYAKITMFDNFFFIKWCPSATRLFSRIYLFLFRCIGWYILDIIVCSDGLVLSSFRTWFSDCTILYMFGSRMYLLQPIVCCSTVSHSGRGGGGFEYVLVRYYGLCPMPSLVSLIGSCLSAGRENLVMFFNFLFALVLFLLLYSHFHYLCSQCVKLSIKCLYLLPISKPIVSFR